VAARSRRVAGAAKDGNVVCLFQSAQKFKTRYATFGFSDKANLDEGAMWPTASGLQELTAAAEARIGVGKTATGTSQSGPELARSAKVSRSTS
jgi:hypothetical protein